MSNDIVEIALDKLTDGILFEKIGCEIMRDEGYHDIKRLGTAHDFGIDAVEDIFYEDQRRSTTIFQFTLEDYVLGKLRDTIEKLKSNKIVMDALVLVTNAPLSPTRQQNLRKVARKEYDVSANCYERGTILNRLSDLSNGIFHRNFPNIQQQISELQASKPIFHDPNNIREMALLRTAIAFGMGPNPNKTRNSMFDQMVLSILSQYGIVGATIEEISQSLSKDLGVPPFPQPQLEASFRRLKTEIDCDNGKYSLTKEYSTHVNHETIKVNSITESLISDVVEDVCVDGKQALSKGDRQRLERNAKAVFCELFRLNSLPLANLATPNSAPQFISPQDLLGLSHLAQRQTTVERGNLLLAALANVISNPSPTQAQVLAGWARVYLGIALMNLDPILRECQATRMREKLFILDTDVVLGAVVRENINFYSYKLLIQRLVDLGARVIIPSAVVVECTNHASRSPRTFHYHKERLFLMTPEVVKGEVRNLFVRAFYNGVINSRTPKSYEKFLANYYDHNDSVGFMKEIIRSEFPPQVEQIDLDALIDRPLVEVDLKRATEKNIEIMRRRKQLGTRTEEETILLASNDAKLLLTSLMLNTRNLTDTSKRILWANSYIVTQSTRYIQAAFELNLMNVVSTTPQQLITIVEAFSGPVATDLELLQLFENPMLNTIVNEIWPDLEKLLQNGIELFGKSLVRLRRDLDSTLHQALLSVDMQDQLTDSEEAGDIDRNKDFVELISYAENLGYNIHPLAIKARDAFSTQNIKDQKIKELEAHLAEFEEVITQFGKKKQRYLRRIAKHER